MWIVGQSHDVSEVVGTKGQPGFSARNCRSHTERSRDVYSIRAPDGIPSERNLEDLAREVADRVGTGDLPWVHLVWVVPEEDSPRMSVALDLRESVLAALAGNGLRSGCAGLIGWRESYRVSRLTIGVDLILERSDWQGEGEQRRVRCRRSRILEALGLRRWLATAKNAGIASTQGN